jgi:hypothetical protein
MFRFISGLWSQIMELEIINSLAEYYEKQGLQINAKYVSDEKPIRGYPYLFYTINNI